MNNLTDIFSAANPESPPDTSAMSLCSADVCPECHQSQCSSLPANHNKSITDKPQRDTATHACEMILR